MSLITDFIAIFGAHQAVKAATTKKAHERQTHYADGFSEPEVYSSFDVEDIYDEDYDNTIDEEWD